jgi:twinfilin-like protein
MGSGGRRALRCEQRIDTSNETIELAGTSSSEADGLAGAISDSEPRYSFFRFSHDFEGQSQSPVVFIYTCPSGSKIKERMLYASSRSGMVSAASGEAGLTVAKKVAICSGLIYSIYY